MNVSVLIPAYNCEKHLPSLIQQINCKIQPVSIIVVDDFSSDNTYSVVKNLPNVIAYKNQKNLGYGGTSNRLYELALIHNVELALNLHADFGHSPDDAHRLIDRYKNSNCDVVIGSRLLYIKNEAKKNGWLNTLLSSEENRMPLIRMLGHLGLTFYQNKCLNSNFHSFHEGMRLCNFSVIEWAAKKNISAAWYDYDSELLSTLNQTKFKIDEIEIKPHYIVNISSSAPPFRYGLRILKQSTLFLAFRCLLALKNYSLKIIKFNQKND